MTEKEAQRILAEHRAECPSFVRGRRLFKVRKDKRCDVYSGNPKTDRWKFEYTVEADDAILIGHPDIKERMS